MNFLLSPGYLQGMVSSTGGLGRLFYVFWLPPKGLSIYTRLECPRADKWPERRRSFAEEPAFSGERYSQGVVRQWSLRWEQFCLHGSQDTCRNSHWHGCSTGRRFGRDWAPHSLCPAVGPGISRNKVKQRR